MKPFDNFMEPFFPRSMRSFWPELDNISQPRLDLQDRGNYFSVTAELPGFAKDDVEVRIDSNSLEIKAEKKSENKENGAKGRSQNKSSYSYFHRYFSLPEEVRTENVDGTMKNGILELRLPKKEPKLEDAKTRRKIDLK
jgi:HSP20 family protein